MRMKKMISWNVNGLRACMKKGFQEYFEAADADIFCLQETKLQQGQIDLPLRYLRKLIDLFDVSADYLLGRTQRPENKSFRNVQVTKDCSCAALLNAVLSLSEEDREAAVEYVRLLRLKERAKKL